jgi:hypothetical protein
MKLFYVIIVLISVYTGYLCSQASDYVIRNEEQDSRRK